MRSIVGKRCYYCNRKLTRKNNSVDHLIPISRGGADKPHNIVDACRKCNSDKAALTHHEYKAVILFRSGRIAVPLRLFPGEVSRS